MLDDVTVIFKETSVYVPKSGTMADAHVGPERPDIKAMILLFEESW